MTNAFRQVPPSRPAAAETYVPAAAKARFISLIPDRVAELDALIEHFSTRGQAPEVLLRMAEATHKIAGTAATLGMARIGALAAKAETDLRRGLAAGTEPVALLRASRATLETLMDEMEDVFMA